MSTASNNTLAVPKEQTLILTVEDGCHYNEQIGEYEVWLGNEIVNYATHQSTAWAQYNDALRTCREHRQRNTLNLTENRIVILEVSNV